MRSSLPLFFAGLFFCQQANAQNLAAEGYVDYLFTHQTDSLQPSKIHTETLRLYFGADMSVYRSLGRLQYDSAQRARLRQATSDNNTLNMNLGQLPRGSIEQFYTIVPEQKTLTYRRFLNVNYLVPDTITPAWELSSETTNILGYTCQKAKAWFKGRLYHVWFATALPYPVGPWKLKGLPGIILRAEDEKGHVRFVASHVVAQPQEFAISLPEKPVYTSRRELSKAIKAHRENPNGATAANGITIESQGGSMLRKMTPANNPVELSEE